MKAKVLQLTSIQYGIGGAENLLLSLADKYDRNKFEFYFCNLFGEKGEHDDFPSEIRRRGHKYINIPGGSLSQLPSILFKLANVIRREKFDIVHTHLRYASIIGAFMAKIAPIPFLISTRHHTDTSYRYQPRYIQILEYIATHNTDHHIAVSEKAKRVMVEKEQVHPKKITVIHNGIHLSKFDQSSFVKENSKLKQEFFPEGVRVVGNVGSLDPVKGQSYLLRAAAKVVAKCPDVRFIIIGQGALRGELEALTRKLGLESYVVFTGHRYDVPQLLKFFDVYVHPSIEESFGIAVIEAMAASKPVVASKVGGIPEIVVDGVTGILVPPEDSDSLADAILQCLSNPVLSEQMGYEGRKRVEAHFTIEQTVAKYQEVYRTALEKRFI